MTLGMTLALLWGGVLLVIVGWGVATWWRDRRAESRASLRLVHRFRSSDETRGE